MATMPTYDYEAEQAEMLRRQKIAEAMQAGSLAPMEMPSTPGARVSPLAAVAKIANAMFARNDQNKIAEDRQKLGERYKTDLVSGMQQFEKTASPREMPAQEEATMGGEVATTPGYTAPGDRKKAVYDALASNHPVLRDFGMTEFKAMNAAKSGLTAKDLLPHAAPSSIPGMISGDTTKFVPKSDLGEVNGIVYDKGTMKIQQLKGDAPGQVTIGGDLYEVNPSTMQLKKLDTAPKINIDNGGGNAFGKAVASTRADVLKDSFKNAQTLPQTLASIDTASAALQAGVKSGAAGEIALAMAKVGKSLGLGDVDPAIANTEQYRSSVAQSVLKVLEKLKPASDTDVQFAKEVAGGQITLDDQTMMRLLDTAKAATWNSYLQHDDLIKRNMAAPGGADAGLDVFKVPMDIRADATKFDFDPKTNQFSVKGNGVPANKGKGKVGTAANPMNLQDYIKSKGQK